MLLAVGAGLDNRRYREEADSLVFPSGLLSSLDTVMDVAVEIVFHVTMFYHQFQHLLAQGQWMVIELSLAQALRHEMQVVEQDSRPPCVGLQIPRQPLQKPLFDIFSRLAVTFQIAGGKDKVPQTRIKRIKGALNTGQLFLQLRVALIRGPRIMVAMQQDIRYLEHFCQPPEVSH